MTECTCDRIPALDRVAMDGLERSWALLASWLPKEGEVSMVDGPSLVAEQWKITKQAYSGLGLAPHMQDNTGEVGD